MKTSTNERPLLAALERIEAYLAGRGYERDAIEAVVDHCRETGSSMGAPCLGDADQDAVEAMLPFDWGYSIPWVGGSIVSLLAPAAV